MKRGKLSKVRLSLACRTRIHRAPITDVAKTILLDFVDTYAKLSEKERVEMQTIVSSEPEYTDVRKSELTWLGKQQAQWDAQGQAKAQAQAVLTVLEARGIPVSNDARQQILETGDHGLLQAWLKRAVVAQSIDEVLKPAG